MTVKSLLETYEIVTLRCSREMYHFNDEGYYVGNGETEALIAKESKEFLEANCTKYDVNEIIFNIQTLTFKDDCFFEKTPPNYICLDNGVLNINDGTISEHFSFVLDEKGRISNVSSNHEYHFLQKIGRIYDPSKYTECPIIDNFLHEVLNTKEDVQAIYEFLGYCLYRDYPFHKAFMFVGEGSNGKSTLLNLMETFLGNANVTHLSLQDLCSSRFALAELRGKLANFYADLKESSITDSGNFKQLTGNDEFSAELKFVQRRIKLKNYAKFAFSCNKIPENRNDDTMAFWRRWIIFQFNKTFIGNKCDPNLLKKLTTLDELNGLLYKAVEGLNRLLKNSKFSNEKDYDITRQQWIKNDSVRSFVEDCLVMNLSSYIPKTKVFDAYRDYCIDNNVSPLEMNIFGRKLKHYIGYREAQKTIDGIRTYCYAGIELKPKLENEQPTL